MQRSRLKRHTQICLNWRITTDQQQPSPKAWKCTWKRANMFCWCIWLASEVANYVNQSTNDNWRRPILEGSYNTRPSLNAGRLVLAEKVLRCASRSKWIFPFLYSDDQWKKLIVSIGSFYPLWLLSVKFKELFLNSFTRFISHFCYLEVQSKEQEISKLSLQRHSVSVDVSDQNFLSFRSAKETHGRFVHATRDQTVRFANSPTQAKHQVMKEKQMMMKAAAIKKKNVFP